MALAMRLSNEAANAELNAFIALLDAGFLDLYDGDQPATCDTPPTTQVKLVRLTLGSPAFNPASAGVADLASPASGLCIANGDASWYRFTKSDDSPVQDGSVATSGANLNLTAVGMVAGATLIVDTFVQTQRKA